MAIRLSWFRKKELDSYRTGSCMGPTAGREEYWREKFFTLQEL